MFYIKKMIIYEPAMCCSTGLCGVSVDPELLRISTVLSNLEKNGVKVERYNLSNAPQEFVKNKEINALITKSADNLPAIVVDGKIVITKRYPTNEEFKSLLGVSASFIGEKETMKVKVHKSGSEGCGCSGGKC